MKSQLLLLLALVLFLPACKQEEEPQPEPVSWLKLIVMKQKQSSTGVITADHITAFIHVWEANNRDFDVEASPDINLGEAYDKTSGTLQSIKYGAIGAKMNEKIIPGKYFVYVVLPKSSGKSGLAYSFTYIEIKEGRNLNITKTFSYDAVAGMFEHWNKNK